MGEYLQASAKEGFIMKYKWIEESADSFNMEVESSVEAYFHIDRDESGKPTNISFSHCRFKLSEDHFGYVEWGPALSAKELGKELAQNFESRIQEMVKNGDFE
jgi:hypothetical protein